MLCHSLLLAVCSELTSPHGVFSCGKRWPHSLKLVSSKSRNCAAWNIHIKPNLLSFSSLPSFHLFLVFTSPPPSSVCRNLFISASIPLFPPPSLHLFPLSRSGLNLAPVARLRSSWEKLPSKYEKLFGDLQDLFDPSRNMAKYRNVLSSQSMQPPIIPLFPVVKKDLTFLHEGRRLCVPSQIIYLHPHSCVS